MMYKIACLLLLWAFSASPIFSQGYSKWSVGDTADFVATNAQGGLVLAGGGTDNDNAMKWMLARAGGGDVVVIRASGSDGYNDYFYSELGIVVHSVETFRFESTTAANDPYLIKKIRDAEVLFIAGGDQYKYYQYWRNTPIEDAINYLLREKKITVGGTSAGMAILSKNYYAPPGASLESAQALANPYHTNIDILGHHDFLDAPFMDDLITDTHYDQRNRQGRHVTFLARLAHDYGQRTFGIACNESTAVCIDEQGRAKVFGDYPAYNDYAYFFKSNCQPEFLPEVVTTGTPLTWNRQESALKVYRLPGNTTGNNLFSLNNWETAMGGQWQDWYVEAGVLLKHTNTDGDCGSISPVNEIPLSDIQIEVSPNPFEHAFSVQVSQSGKYLLNIFDVFGRPVWAGEKYIETTETITPDSLLGNVFWVSIRNDHVVKMMKVVKK